MKINNELSNKVVENNGCFENDFYKRFSQKQHTVNLGENISKTYNFPTFYGEVTLSIMIFLCSFEKALKLMPDRKMKPVRMTGGRSMIVFSCYEYNNVKEMTGYNEVGISIPVLYGLGLNIPILPVIFGKYFNNAGYHVIFMPVTSLESKIRGDQVWGLPKKVQEIDFADEDDCRVCSIKDRSGQIYLQLRTPKSGRKIDLDETTYLYTKKDGRILRSQTWFKGNFLINKFNSLLIKPLKRKTDFIHIRDLSDGVILNGLEIEEHPFQTRFSSYVASAFDLPEDL